MTTTTQEVIEQFALYSREELEAFATKYEIPFRATISDDILRQRCADFFAKTSREAAKEKEAKETKDTNLEKKVETKIKEEVKDSIGFNLNAETLKAIVSAAVSEAVKATNSIVMENNNARKVTTDDFKNAVSLPPVTNHENKRRCLEMVRVSVTPLALSGSGKKPDFITITTGNGDTGTITVQVPFSHYRHSWHIPRIVVDVLKAAEYSVPSYDENAIDPSRAMKITRHKKYAVEELPPMTEHEKQQAHDANLIARLMRNRANG